jgi:hypothetical protein
MVNTEREETQLITTCGTALDRKVNETLVSESMYIPVVNTLLEFCRVRGRNVLTNTNGLDFLFECHSWCCIDNRWVRGIFILWISKVENRRSHGWGVWILHISRLSVSSCTSFHYRLDQLLRFSVVCRRITTYLTAFDFMETTNCGSDDTSATPNGFRHKYARNRYPLN